MPLELITATDERERCCVVHDGRRCERTTEVRFAMRGSDEHEQELYAYTCTEHAAEAAAELGPEYVATRVD